MKHSLQMMLTLLLLFILYNPEIKAQTDPLNTAVETDVCNNLPEKDPDALLAFNDRTDPASIADPTSYFPGSLVSLANVEAFYLEQEETNLKMERWMVNIDRSWSTESEDPLQLEQWMLEPGTWLIAD